MNWRLDDAHFRQIHVVHKCGKLWNINLVGLDVALLAKWYGDRLRRLLDILHFEEGICRSGVRSPQSVQPFCCCSLGVYCMHGRVGNALGPGPPFGRFLTGVGGETGDVADSSRGATMGVW
jgi:hypothetical protein